MSEDNRTFIEKHRDFKSNLEFKKEQFCIKDALIIATMVLLYNVCISIAYDTLQYINKYKILWGFIGGIFAFVPMYAITWVTLRKMKSKLWFFLVSLFAWLIEPILMSQGHSKTFNAWQGKHQIFENGQLTVFGYFHGLQHPFFFLVVYAAIIFALHIYKNFNTKLRGV